MSLDPSNRRLWSSFLPLLFSSTPARAIELLGTMYTARSVHRPSTDGRPLRDPLLLTVDELGEFLMNGTHSNRGKWTAICTRAGDIDIPAVLAAVIAEPDFFNEPQVSV